MTVSLGVKTDPVEYRYSYEWLWRVLRDLSIRYVQLGSFFELYSLEDGYFTELKDGAKQYGIIIKSCFTSHRELGGFFSGNPYLEKAARKAYEKLIHAASLLGADYAGSNPGSIYRDRISCKDKGIECYIRHMKELTMLAHEKGLKALTMEPMSSLAEPPSTPEEIDYILSEVNSRGIGREHGCVPLYICGDISHGLADSQGKVVHDNLDFFIHQIPHMAEFHFKNTDRLFNATFGFSKEEQTRGKVDLRELKKVVADNASRFPVKEMIGYFETSGPKLGRDYSDINLKDMLTNSIREIQRVF